MNTKQTKILELGKVKGIEYFEYYYNNSAKPWFHNLHWDRKYIVTINRCRSNHYSLAASLARKNIISSPQCPCEYESQDLDHVVWQCNLFVKQRKQLVSELRQKNIFLPNKMTCLLCNPRSSVCNMICKFFAKCNLDV